MSPRYSYELTADSVESANTFQWTGCSDCAVCGKAVAQIQHQVADEDASKTVTIGETPMKTEARKIAFLDGISMGFFLIMPGSVTQAPVRNGNVYSMHTNTTISPWDNPLD